ncbi:toll/interleukin-1 receptor domain-containing protein [Rhodococcus maanshanensis]|uniref:TIR domain-containing protein n=1 Tax=Rhodococcus maanshanensis TaxID=183556 RepID=A0A1H7U4A8_9NOCA|nr:toll/interleukin-1 receptor domain-containing protein [Rhodococcus maanshanensis]SEL91077.1 TIR domain-containing protein [Rhodococcus maanshanensis]
MSVNDEDFWDDLLSHIREQRLVPVVGPELNVVGDNQQTLTALIGERLVEKHGLTVPPGVTTMGEAVAEFLRKRGQIEGDRLYRDINKIIATLDPQPGDALRDLAAIDDFRLLVATTPDRLLAKAVNEVRFNGRPMAREIAFSPTQSTSEHSYNAEAPAAAETVVLNLFGRAAATPQYAIHEEDRLEWMHALLSDTASLPDWLNHQLKDCALLFIGCEIPDWVGRFLLRMSTNGRLSVEQKQFFFAGCSSMYEPSLSDFFETYCRSTQVQQLSVSPTEFVAELKTRWEQESGPRPWTPEPAPRRSPADTPTIFISYMREDAHAARQVCDAIQDLGGDVWLDDRRLLPGDDWHTEILSAIRRNVRLFIPIISANTERVEEGYVFTEWYEALQRSRRIPGRSFIVPVVIDDDYTGSASAYPRMRDRFGHLHIGHAPAGEPDMDLLTALKVAIRDMRRPANDAA